MTMVIRLCHPESSGFALLVLGSLFPFQPLDATWQIRLGAVLVNAATLPLLALALLQLARQLSPRDPCSQLRRDERQLAGLRQAVAQAASNADLGARFQALNGPGLSPADLALPLPVLKAQATLALDQAQAQLARQRDALPAADPWRRLPELLRSAGACLALAGGFAIFARRSEEERSLLEGLQKRLALLRQRLGARRRQGYGSGGQQEYLRRLQDGDPQRG